MNVGVQHTKSLKISEELMQSSVLFMQVRFTLLQSPNILEKFEPKIIPKLVLATKGVALPQN